MSIKKLIAGSVASLTAFALVGVVSAAPINTNGSFETGVDPGAWTMLPTGDTTSVDGWTVSSGTVDYIGTYWTSADGIRSLDLTGSDGTAGAVSQTFPTVVGHNYTVTFDLAGNPAGAPVVKSLEVDAGGAASPYTFDTTGKDLSNMGWEQKTFTFTATDTTTTLTFTSLDLGFFGPALDNVVVTADALSNKNQCKNGGWAASTNPVFKNQGDCVSYFQSSPKAQGNRKDNPTL